MESRGFFAFEYVHGGVSSQKPWPPQKAWSFQHNLELIKKKKKKAECVQMTWITNSSYKKKKTFYLNHRSTYILESKKN